jgi:omega-amidase
MRVAAFQFDVLEDDPDGNLAAVERGLAQAADQGCALVVLPEMWPTSFTPRVGEEQLAASERALEALAAWSKAHALVVCGSAYGRVPGDGALPANRMHIFDDGVQVVGYDKVHLFSPAAEQFNFTAGSAAPPMVSTSAGKLAPVVCYDLRFPELARVSFRAGAEVLVCCAQWATTRASHWSALLAGRAVEGQWFVVGANRTGSAVVGRRRLKLEFPGNSMVVSPDGEVLASGAGAPGLVVADIDLEQARALRRTVPVHKDERAACYRSWLQAPG